MRTVAGAIQIPAVPGTVRELTRGVLLPSALGSLAQLPKHAYYVSMAGRNG
jgi:hypothetical protein